MKKLLSAAAMVMVIAGSAVAQGGGGGGRPPMTPEQMTAMMNGQVDVMFKGVTLSDASKAKAIEILTKAQTDRRALDRQAPDFADKSALITKKRTEDLMALGANDADKAAIKANIDAMPTGRGGPRPPPPTTR